MKQFSGPVLLAGLVLLLLAACGGPAVQPLTFSPAPWSDGEVNSYDVIGRDGAHADEVSGWVHLDYDVIIDWDTLEPDSDIAVFVRDRVISEIGRAHV